MEKTRVALVEDDVELAQWITEYLEAKQYKVTVYHDGISGFEGIKLNPPELVILDGMLPGMDGLDVCRELRNTMALPILMLTARDEEVDEIIGLEMGADDYLTKPVRGRLLEARIKNLLRRTAPCSVSSAIVLGQLEVNPDTRNVILNGINIKVSSNEFDVLWALAQHAGSVVTRDALIQQLRGFEYDGFDRSIDLRISRLRKKLGDTEEPYKIATVWGKGYQLAKDVW
ncbi:response regulator transcription factor [Pseudoalteromonas luteoviolacea]|uniref:response regulator transcription factor n=1 Tax=Pseudoalteromonas luteoviolacea TaxID=43657 RepID=UPI00114FDE01|nr:response regulator transcription factor [Pseudoalteromonas luteoviolacea]TQF68125.1 response regulator transcription factor [Pseudoalteromonas luteoviolacea]